MIAGAIFLAVALVALVVVAVPLAVSNDAVHARLERELAALTGQRVTLGESRSVRFWPVPTVTMRSATVTSRRYPDAPPILQADEITAEFSLFSALTGNPRFSDFLLVRPTFGLELYPGGRTSWMTDSGPIAEGAAIAAEGEAGEQQPLPTATLGTLRIENGTLQIVDRTRDRTESVTAINGTISWPRIGVGARANFGGVLRGEPITVVAASDQPVELLAGNVAPFEFTLSSDLLNIDYDGTAVFADNLMLTGAVMLSSPSARRALQWSGTDLKPGEAIGALEVEADLQVSGRQVRFDDLILDIDDNRGIGALDIALPADGRPHIAGTLAYDTLDVGAFLRAFTPLPTEGSDISETIDTGFLRQLGLDLRLSAQTARVGPVTLQNMAAAARIEEGRALFDIGDASAFGGNILGRVAISEDGFSGGGELQLSAQNVDFGAIYEAVGFAGPLPRGTGTMNLSVRSPNPVWATALGDLQGTIDVAIQNGVVPMFDLARFRELSRTERFFDVGQAGGGELPFRSAAFAASFAGGTAEVTRGELFTDNATVMLSGLIPYNRGSLALSGTIGPPQPAAPAAPAAEGTEPAPPPEGAPPPLRFFIGGSWPNPVISPIMSN